MNTKSNDCSSPADSPDRDENHDETRRNGFHSQDGPSDGVDKTSTSRDENHDELRINGYDPEVAEALRGEVGSRDSREK